MQIHEIPCVIRVNSRIDTEPAKYGLYKIIVKNNFAQSY